MKKSAESPFFGPKSRLHAGCVRRPDGGRRLPLRRLPDRTAGGVRKKFQYIHPFHKRGRKRFFSSDRSEKLSFELQNISNPGHGKSADTGRKAKKSPEKVQFDNLFNIFA
ncbi:hypothetical protein [uncultured Alistipes sp.]|jgi:hypothetical protein|uniref:hypothetical protein n=1 Tax=uncultured Alistipes sp. TaxID=538949 RepID=UPI0025D74D86|nr:hypothetical protein [uncultured Alistipes sp.]